MMWMPWVTLFVGLIILVWASDWLVDGAIALAGRLGLSPLVVGLTVVAYGTSLPEFVVSLFAASNGVSDIAVGNVVGSNIANFGLAWGAALLVGTGLITQRSVFRRELPAVILASLAFVVLGIDGTFTRIEGVFLLGFAVVYTVVALRSDGSVTEGTSSDITLPKTMLLLIVGAVGLVFGADLMVDGAISIARGYGINERIIGLTIIALGTSLPEVAATVTAARKNEGELALGNILGSCLFNLTFVIGGASMFTPLLVDDASKDFDIPVMLGVSVFAAALIYVFKKGSRWHGALLLLIYFTFLGILANQTFN
jgi:cation:H+ antiporter